MCCVLMSWWGRAVVCANWLWWRWGGRLVFWLAMHYGTCSLWDDQLSKKCVKIVMHCLSGNALYFHQLAEILFLFGSVPSVCPADVHVTPHEASDQRFPNRLNFTLQKKHKEPLHHDSTTSTQLPGHYQDNLTQVWQVTGDSGTDPALNWRWSGSYLALIRLLTGADPSHCQLLCWRSILQGSHPFSLTTFQNFNFFSKTKVFKGPFAIYKYTELHTLLSLRRLGLLIE